MTDAERKMISSSLPVILKNKGKLRQSFYRRLFETLPESEALFKREPAHQGIMFERQLVDIFYACTQHGALEAHVVDFVRLHKKYEFDDRYFTACEAALVGMFEDCSRDRHELDDDVLSLWQSQVRELVRQFKAAYLAS